MTPIRGFSSRAAAVVARAPGPDQRLPDAHKLPDLGQQPLQQRELRRPPAIRGHRIAETPGYVGAIRPVQAHVQALLKRDRHRGPIET